MFFSEDELICNYEVLQGYWEKPLALWYKWPKRFHLLPAHDNDRPFGWAFIALNQEVFGVNYYSQVACMIGWHSFNATLLYFFLKKITNLRQYALAGSILFVCCYPINSAAYYIGAIFDVSCATFVLLSLIFFQHRNKSRFFSVLSVLCYYFSIRAKLISLLLPVVITVLSIYEIEGKAFRTKIIESIKASWFYYVPLALILVHLYAKGQLGKEMSETDPYYMDFSFYQFYKNLDFYAGRILHINNQLIIKLYLLIILLLSIIGKNKLMIISILCSILMMFPVMFFRQHSFDIYMYVPSIFYVMIFINIFIVLNEMMKFKRHCFILLMISLSLSALSINSARYTDHSSAEKKVRTDTGLIYNYLVSNRENIKPNTKLYISGVKSIERNQNSYWKLIDYLIFIAIKDHSVKAYTDNLYPNLAEKFKLDPGPKIFLQYEEKNGIESLSTSSNGI